MNTTKKLFTIKNIDKIKHYEFDRYIVESAELSDLDSIVYKFKLLDKRDMKSTVTIKLSRVINESFKKNLGKLGVIVSPNGQPRKISWIDKDDVSSPYNFLKKIIHILETQK